MSGLPKRLAAKWWASPFAPVEPDADSECAASMDDEARWWIRAIADELEADREHHDAGRWLREQAGTE